MKKAILFGSSGQDGHYLSLLLRDKGFEVIGIGRPERSNGTDISDFQSVSRLIADHKPEFIFHLAANSTTKHEALFENHNTIVTGGINILESVRNFSPSSKVFISGSGLQFRNENKPIRETDPFEARDAYSASRIQSVFAARYFRTLGLNVYVGYFFNHDSPVRTERHMSKKIAEAAKRIGAGQDEKLVIGDLDAVKEYGFAGDIVRGVWTLVNQDNVYEATISTGAGYTIKDWLELCFSRVNKNWRDFVVPDPEFVSGYSSLVSDPSRIFSLGWKPEMNIEMLADCMMRNE